MTNGKYIDYYDFDSEKVDELLKSTNVREKLDGLLLTVLGSGDYEKSDKLVFEFCQSSEENLRINATLCIGHMARIHKMIDLEKYLPILESIISDQNHGEDLIDCAESALNDIWIYCGKKKVREFRNGTCISRFFQTLEISNDSEENENFQEGIKRISKLRAGETNPSVQRVQETSITFLSHFI